MKHLLPALVLIGSGILLSGCGGSSSSTSPETAISIPFKAVAGNESIRCGETITGLGIANTDVKLADFRMFVHDIKLITDQLIEVPVRLDASQSSQNEDVALLDFRDKVEIDGESTEVCAENNTENSQANPNYNDTVKGSVIIDPAYTFSHIQFTLGVPFSLNHADQSSAEDPLRNPGLASGMAWSWQAGYKFTGFDVRPVGGVIRPSNQEWSSPKWNVHLGSTGCPVSVSDLNSGIAPQACSAPNRVTVRLALGSFELDSIAIQIDYADLVSMSNLGQDEGNAPGCMSGGSDPECEEVFDKLGIAWGSNAAVEQNVFAIVEL